MIDKSVVYVRNTRADVTLQSNEHQTRIDDTSMIINDENNQIETNQSNSKQQFDGNSTNDVKLENVSYVENTLNM